LDRKVLRWIEEKVEEGVFASRSHAVEYAVRQLMRNDGKAKY
jgi:Arc/MetJ-type ribon-helix-helix transcriptional regulator